MTWQVHEERQHPPPAPYPKSQHFAGDEVSGREVREVREVRERMRMRVRVRRW